MFESKIQLAWKDYKRDLAFSRITLWVCLFQFFLAFFSSLLMERIIYEPIYPVILAIILLYLIQQKLIRRQVTFFIINALFLTIVIVSNYLFIGLVAQVVDNLVRFDSFFSQMDYLIFSTPVAVFLLKFFSIFGDFRFLIYDFLQISYMTYYLFPFFGGIFYYRQLGRANKYKVGRFLSSVAIFFSLNYFFYILVPVSGPIYYLDEVKQLNLDFSFVGDYLHQLVARNHPNYIDCFPSGHTGISVLVTFWMFKIKNHYRYIFLIFCLGMIFATLSLKYHYTLDVLCALPFALLCFWLGHKLVPTGLDIRQKRKWKF